MKNIITIALLAFCACNEIQIPENHTAIETFKKKKVKFKLDDSYPEQWRNDAVEGRKHPGVNKYYKLSFVDKDSSLRITKQVYECEKVGNNIKVWMQTERSFWKLFKTVYKNITLPKKDYADTVWDAALDLISYNDLKRFYNSGMLTEYGKFYFETDYIVFNGEMMKLITPEMEKELNAKEI